jgi:hypothetical protein
MIKRHGPLPSHAFERAERKKRQVQSNPYKITDEKGQGKEMDSAGMLHRQRRITASGLVHFKS